MPAYRNIETGRIVEVLEGTRMCKAYELVTEEKIQEKQIKKDLEVPKPKKSAKESRKKVSLKKKEAKSGKVAESSGASSEKVAPAEKTSSVTKQTESVECEGEEMHPTVESEE